ncbi:MAG: hypothetical protein WA121_04305 [Syntrophales bacterium]
MTAATSRTKNITIPLLLLLVGTLLQIVLPNFDTLEKLLLSYLKHKWLVWELKLSTLAFFVLLPYRAYQKHVQKYTSASLIESYMDTKSKIKTECYKTDVVFLGRELASKGLAGSGSAIVRNKDLKLSHVHRFVSVCLEYIDSTKGNYSLDKPSVKALFADYKDADITDVTTTITNQYAARGLPLNQSVLSSAVTDIENTYSIALLKIDAM